MNPLRIIGRALLALVTVRIRYTILVPLLGISAGMTLALVMAVPGLHHFVCPDTPHNPEYLVRSVAASIQTVTKIRTTYYVAPRNALKLKPGELRAYGQALVAAFDSNDVATGRVDTASVHRLSVQAWKGMDAAFIVFIDTDSLDVIQRRQRAAPPFSVEGFTGYHGIVSSICWDCYLSRIREDLGTLMFLFATANPTLRHGQDVYDIERLAWQAAAFHVNDPLARRIHGVLFGLGALVVCCSLIFHVLETTETRRRALATRRRYERRHIPVRPLSAWLAAFAWDSETFLRWYEQRLHRQEQRWHRDRSAAAKAQRSREREERERELMRAGLDAFRQRVASFASTVSSVHPHWTDIVAGLSIARDDGLPFNQRLSALIDAEQLARNHESPPKSPVETRLHRTYEGRLREQVAAVDRASLTASQRAAFQAALAEADHQRESTRVRALERALAVVVEAPDDECRTLAPAVAISEPLPAPAVALVISSMEDIEQRLDLGRYLPPEIDTDHATKIVMVLLGIGQTGQSAFNARYLQVETVRHRVRSKLGPRRFSGAAYDDALEFLLENNVVVVTKKKHGTKLIALNAHHGKGAGKNKRPVRATALGSRIIKEVVRLVQELRSELEP